MAKSRKGQMFVVANYYPPGNYIGSYTENVPPEGHELGMGMARSKTGRIIVVANYNPRGNYIGSFHNNVLPKIA
ncbi:hypothetical protein J437_LFUL015948 [Ladona fulva]|uniref:Uncharacterized protein n=1 Tax=Ladona fulva TaxID=123851 RepID=A0A8K0KM43_LADFU|nr:hypothetical protein J437_LFUL015948 [Ladona fulva]